MAGGVCLAQRRCEARTSMKTCGEVVCVDASRGRSELFDYTKGFVRKGRSYCVSGWSKSDGLTLVGLPAILKRTGEDVGFHPMRFRPVEELSGDVLREICRTERGNGKPQRILLVDDDQDLLDMWREILVGGLRGRPEILTAIRDEEGILTRHFVESIVCARALPAGIATLLDVGSGAGFPGIPIALCRSEIAVTLAESQGKKAAFLQEAVRVLGVAA